MSAQRKVGLGRGISALIPTPDIEPKIASDEAVLSVSISDIRPNPRQPRSEFREDDLNELTDSILAHGIIQPLILTIDDETKKIFPDCRRTPFARRRTRRSADGPRDRSDRLGSGTA